MKLGWLSDDNAVAQVASALFGPALWLLTRPFTFTENDGYLYAFMALARVDPGRFSDDLFVKFGSQDSFSLFSPIYSSAISAIGFTPAVFLLLLASAGLWLLSTWALLHALMPAKRARIVFLPLCALRVAYTGFGGMIISEGFLTARLSAEALTLAALTLLIRKRWFWAALTIFAAGAIHPVQAFAGVAVAFLYLGLRYRAVLLAGAASLACVGVLAVLNLSPFDRLLQVVDPAWMRGIREHSGFVFVSQWLLSDWIRFFIYFSSVVPAAFKTKGPIRRLMIAVLVVAIAGIAVSYVGGDLLKSVLMLQLQLSRAGWLLAWFAVASVGLLAPSSRKLADWLGVILLCVSYVSSPILGLIFSIIALILNLDLVKPSLLSSKVAFAVAGFLVLLDFTGTAAVLAIQYRALDDLGVPQFGIQKFIGTYTWLTLLLALTLVWLRPRWALVCAIPFLVLSSIAWDRRTPVTKLEMQGALSQEFTHGSVLWGPGAAEAWFLARRPNFLSTTQSSGMIFSRAATIEWYSRLHTAAGVVPTEAWDPGAEDRECEVDQPQLDVRQLTEMCRAKEHPAYWVTPRPVAGIQPLKTIRMPSEQQICRGKHGPEVRRYEFFFVYQCS